MEQVDILELLDKTEVVQRIKKIREVYQDLEEKQKKFCACFHIHCKDGCGKCCEHFNPDITEVEAEFLAYGLIKEGKAEEVLELLSTKDGNSEYCPLYNFDDNEHHCSVYQYRPLICRLFGATASKAKTGEPSFRQCKWNDDKSEITSSILNQYKDALIFMGDYGMKIDDIDSDGRNTTLIKEALTRAIMKIEYMLELEEESLK